MIYEWGTVFFLLLLRILIIHSVKPSPWVLGLSYKDTFAFSLFILSIIAISPPREIAIVWVEVLNFAIVFIALLVVNLISLIFERLHRAKRPKAIGNQVYLTAFGILSFWSFSVLNVSLDVYRKVMVNLFGNSMPPLVSGVGGSFESVGGASDEIYYQKLMSRVVIDLYIGWFLYVFVMLKPSLSFMPESLKKEDVMTNGDLASKTFKSLKNHSLYPVLLLIVGVPLLIASHFTSYTSEEHSLTATMVSSLTDPSLSLTLLGYATIVDIAFSVLHIVKMAEMSLSVGKRKVNLPEKAANNLALNVESQIDEFDNLSKSEKENLRDILLKITIDSVWKQFNRDPSSEPDAGEGDDDSDVDSDEVSNSFDDFIVREHLVEENLDSDEGEEEEQNIPEEIDEKVVDKSNGEVIDKSNGEVIDKSNGEVIDKSNGEVIDKSSGEVNEEGVGDEGDEKAVKFGSANVSLESDDKKADGSSDCDSVRMLSSVDDSSSLCSTPEESSPRCMQRSKSFASSGKRDLSFEHSQRTRSNSLVSPLPMSAKGHLRLSLKRIEMEKYGLFSIPSQRTLDTNFRSAPQRKYPVTSSLPQVKIELQDSDVNVKDIPRVYTLPPKKPMYPAGALSRSSSDGVSPRVALTPVQSPNRRPLSSRGRYLVASALPPTRPHRRKLIQRSKSSDYATSKSKRAIVILPSTSFSGLRSIRSGGNLPHPRRHSSSTTPRMQSQLSSAEASLSNSSIATDDDEPNLPMREKPGVRTSSQRGTVNPRSRESSGGSEDEEIGATYRHMSKGTQRLRPHIKREIKIGLLLISEDEELRTSVHDIAAPQSNSVRWCIDLKKWSSPTVEIVIKSPTTLQAGLSHSITCPVALVLLDFRHNCPRNWEQVARAYALMTKISRNEMPALRVVVIDKAENREKYMSLTVRNNFGNRKTRSTSNLVKENESQGGNNVVHARKERSHSHTTLVPSAIVAPTFSKLESLSVSTEQESKRDSSESLFFDFLSPPVKSLTIDSLLQYVSQEQRNHWREKNPTTLQDRRTKTKSYRARSSTTGEGYSASRKPVTEHSDLKLRMGKLSDSQSNIQAKVVEELRHLSEPLFLRKSVKSVDLTSLRYDYQRLRSLFLSFVPEEYQRLVSPDLDINGLRLGRFVCMPVTILFSDIRDFTSLSEGMVNSSLMEFLNAYLAFALPPIEEVGGFVDKFIGDSIMSIFPHANLEMQAQNALKAAIKMLRNLDMMVDDYGFQHCVTGIGINSGRTLIGLLGTETRLEPTSIGDPVNVASRTEALCKTYESRLLITENTFQALGRFRDDFTIRFVDNVTLKGKNVPIKIYEVVDADKKKVFRDKLLMMPTWKKSIELFNSGRFNEALGSLKDYKKINHKDKVCDIYIERCEELLELPDFDISKWRGVYCLDRK